MKKIVFFFSFVCVCIVVGENAPNDYIKMKDVLTSEAISVDSTRDDSYDFITLEPGEEISYSVDWYKPLIAYYVPKYKATVSCRLHFGGSDTFLLCESDEETPSGKFVWNYYEDDNIDLTKKYRLTHTISSNNVEIVSNELRVQLIPEPTVVAITLLIAFGFFMKRYNKIVLPILFIAFAFAQPLLADVSINYIKLIDRTPWNSKIDIEYELSSKRNSDVFEVKFQGCFDNGEKFDLVSLDGEGMCGVVLGTGKHVVTWDMMQDRPGVRSDNFKVTIEASDITDYDYLVLDLFTFKMKASKKAPKDITSNLVCRTDQLWLKRCNAGDFLMGSPETEVGSEEYRDRETQHQVKISRPFYMGIFEHTLAQCSLILGRDIDYRKYMDEKRGDIPIRNSYGTKHVLTPFFGEFRGYNQSSEVALCSVLQRKTGLYFELPTEAQWEFACRAGTKSAIYSGEELNDPEVSDNLDELAVYQNNSTGSYVRVGTKKPNAWGFYDMLGNAPEVVLDVDIFRSENEYKRPDEDVTDPLYVKKGHSYRLYKRGGEYKSPAKECRSAFVDKVSDRDIAGFRLSLQFPGQNK